MIRFLDTETVGFTGPIVLMQYANDDGPVQLYHVWREPVRKTLKLIEKTCGYTLCIYNATYDVFHLNKLYNLFIDKTKDLDTEPNPSDYILDQYEYPIYHCVKPANIIDPMLILRKTELQSLIMQHKPIVIRRVPAVISRSLKRLLEKELLFPDILFQRKALGYSWHIDEKEKDFHDLKLIFAPAGGLKPVCQHLFKMLVHDFPLKDVPKDEPDYNPYNNDWIPYIRRHVDYWWNDRQAKVYAEDDILLLRRLYDHLYDSDYNIEHNDIDSILAGCVGATRWRGLSVDVQSAIDLFNKNKAKLRNIPVNINSPQQVKNYLTHNLSIIEMLSVKNTNSKLLKKLSKNDNELGKRCKEILTYRRLEKENEVLAKLIVSGRFNPSFNIIGTKSGRMSGGNLESKGESLNPQGINRKEYFRKLFTFADNSFTLSGGDFISFEPSIADVVYQDPVMREELKSGKKFHGLFGEQIYDMPYDDIVASTKTDNDYYTRSKIAGLAYLYGAEAVKLAEVLEIEIGQAVSAVKRFEEKYKYISRRRKEITKAFTIIEQPYENGPIFIKDSQNSMPSLLGFKRYFNIENMIIRQLYKLANNLSETIDAKGMVYRKNRQQTVRGAVQSALFAAAFNIQSRNVRAACNHEIQSTGGELNKILQASIWNHQPSGVRPWEVAVINEHDELCVVHRADRQEAIRQQVDTTIAQFRKLVPLIGMDWYTGQKYWGEKNMMSQMVEVIKELDNKTTYFKLNIPLLTGEQAIAVVELLETFGRSIKYGITFTAHKRSSE